MREMDACINGHSKGIGTDEGCRIDSTLCFPFSNCRVPRFCFYFHCNTDK